MSSPAFGFLRRSALLCAVACAATVSPDGGFTDEYDYWTKAYADIAESHLIDDHELLQGSLAGALTEPELVAADMEANPQSLAEASQPNRPSRRRSSRRRRRSATNPLAARVARLEKEVKFLRAWIEKLAGKPPVPPHVAACKGKDEGDTCEFSPWPGKDPIKGKCMKSEKDDSMLHHHLWCKPAGKPPSRPEGPPHVAACKDKDEGDTCEFSPRPGWKPIKGKCMESEKDGKKIMWCKPTEVPPPVEACKGKEEGDTCEFSPWPGKDPIKGKCMKAKGDDKMVMHHHLWCKPAGKPPGGGRRRSRRRRSKE